MIARARTAARLLSALALATLAVVPTRAAALPDPDETPTAASDFPDPFVLRDGDTYYAFATGIDDGYNLQVARSRDLATWTMLGDALPVLPSWATKNFTWAPSVLRRDRRYVLYYTARETSSGFQCISRGTSMRPEGPYHDDSPRPFICQTSADAAFCGSIDPSPFVDAAGRVYLLWKSDENSPACRTQPRIWSQRLSDDGLALVGSPSPLLTTDREWEGPLIEGPSMVRDGDSLFLFYSANWFESADYAIGWARCESPVGPCKKMSLDAPLMKSAGAMLGPGGQEIFTDTLGRSWMAYHAWTAPRTTYSSGGVRSLRLSRLSFSNGTPAIEPAQQPRL
jgi:beta-xylosidase